MGFTHLNMPKPYPDELLYSVVARYAHYFNNQSRRSVSKSLLGKDSLVISTLFPARLERLQGLCETVWKIALSDIALKHTVLPFYLMGSHGGIKRNTEILKSVYQDTELHLHKALGITTTKINIPTRLRYCAKCVEDDRLKYGEAYWHVCHQLPGVYVCANHGVVLQRSQARVQPKRRIAPLTAEQSINPDEDDKEPLAMCDLPRALEYALAAYKSLIDYSTTANPGECINWKEVLTAHGFNSSHGSLSRLHDEFVAYWGGGLIGQIESDWQNGGRLPWVFAIRQKQRKSLHPARQLMMRIFLDSLHEGKADSGYGTGPWQCQNWLADHHKQRVVKRYEDISDHRHPERKIRRFYCDCGFVFTRYAEAVGGKKDFRIVNFGPLFTREAKAFADAGYSTHGIATALEVDWKTANRLLQEENDCVDAQSTNSKLTMDQAKWLTLIQDHPDDGVKLLRKRDPALYARLYRSAREWLRTNQPCEKRSTQRSTRVKWDERDREYAELASLQAMWLLDNMPNIRITKTAILVRIGRQSTIEKNLDKLPVTQAILARVCETKEMYRLRRLRQAANQVGVNAARSKIIRISGIRPEFIDQKLLSLVGCNKREP